MRTNTVRDVATEANDDPTAPGQVVVCLKGVNTIGAAPRFRLKLVDAPFGDPRWPDGEHAPVDVRETSEGVHVTIGADLAAHAMLAPGTAVLMEIGEFRGEFLWPTVTLAQQPKRKRISLRVVAPPPVVITPTEAAAHNVSSAVLDFERTSSATRVDEAPVTAAPSTIITPVDVIPAPSVPMPAVSEAANEAGPLERPSKADAPQHAPDEISTRSLAAFRHIEKNAANDTLPSIFSTDEWPTTARPTDALQRKETVPTTPMDAPSRAASPEKPTKRPTSDVFPKAAETANGDAHAPKRPARLSLPVIEADATSASEPIAETTNRTSQSRWRAVMAQVDRMPAMAAAALGFVALSAIAAGALLWPTTRSTADARGAAFQDQRRWQDGQMLKPVVVKPAPPMAPAIKPTAPPTPPVVTASTAVPVPCLTPEPKATALPAGMMSIGLRSSCHRQQAVTLTYGSLDLKRRFDVDGGLDVTIDCIFGASVPVSISFANGKSISVQTVCQDLDRVSKFAVIWRQPVDLDLHVFERPAAPGVIGQINSARPGVRDAARELSRTERAARGFLSSISTAKSLDGGEGVRMMVYTAFHPPQTTTQSVPVAVDFATRGEKAVADTCAGGKFASPSYEIVRLTARGQVTREEGQFAAFSCGSIVAPTLRFNQSLHAPLRIRN